MYIFVLRLRPLQFLSAEPKNPSTDTNLALQIFANSLALSIIFPYDYITNLYPDIAHQVIKINDPATFTDKQKLAYLHLQGLLSQFIKVYFLKIPTKYLEQQRLIDEILCLLLANFTEDKKDQEQISERKIYTINRLQYITQYVNNHYQE